MGIQVGENHILGSKRATLVVGNADHLPDSYKISCKDWNCNGDHVTVTELPEWMATEKLLSHIKQNRPNLQIVIKS